MPFVRVTAALLAGALLAACGGDDASSASSDDRTVTMKLITFRPANLTVEVGETVTWKQTDAGSHTVTSGTVEQTGGTVSTAPDDKFDSGDIKTNDDYSFTFDEAGTYPYFCALHPATMRGEITVR